MRVQEEGRKFGTSEQPRRWAPSPPPPSRSGARAVKLPKLTNPDLVAMTALGGMVRDALHIFARLPRVGPSDRVVGEWLPTIAEWIDRADEHATVRESPPSAAAISTADYVMELLFLLKAEDAFLAKLIAGRAARIPWKRLAFADPERRSRRMLGAARLKALWRMLQHDRQRRRLADQVAAQALEAGRPP